MATYVAVRGLNRSSQIRVPGINIVAPPAGLSATIGATTGGTFGAATYYYVVTAVSDVGETNRSNEVNLAVGANNVVHLTWTAATGANSYNVYRGTGAGTEGALLANVTTTTYDDTGAAGTAQTPPTGQTVYKVNRTKLTGDTDTVVNLDDLQTRRALANHGAIGQWIISAANHFAGTSALPANS